MQTKQASVSSKAEEYLEAIYRLERKRGSAKTMELAHDLNVVPGSVTNTIEGLERRGLVTHKPYRGVKLTEKGRKLALDVLRRHRLVERLLTDVLHLDWSEVHEPACKLEHAIPADIVKPLQKILGHPRTCPHGNPIPTACGVILEEKSEPLMNLDAGESGTIVKITDEKADGLQRLAILGMTPGVRVEMEEKPPFHGHITIKVGEESSALEYKVASKIHVRRTREERGDDDGVTSV
jgi:DtxR family Mn-dependent transcriptional regulator